MARQYYNSNTHDWYTEGQSVTRKIDNGTLFAGVPSEKQLNDWGYEEHVPPTPIEPTEEDIRRQRMDEILSELAATDYLALKAFEGEDMSEHPGWKEQRRELREEYRRLEQHEA